MDDRATGSPLRRRRAVQLALAMAVAPILMMVPGAKPASAAGAGEVTLVSHTPLSPTRRPSA